MFDQPVDFSLTTFWKVLFKWWQLIRRQPLYSLLILTLIGGLCASLIGGYFLWRIGMEMKRTERLSPLNAELNRGSMVSAASFDGVSGEEAGELKGETTSGSTTRSIAGSTSDLTQEFKDGSIADLTGNSTGRLTAESAPQIQVYISGEVEQPGVQVLTINSRVGHAIDAAGGFTKWADQDYVARQLNLARVLTDGEQIYVPRFDEAENNLQTGSELKTTEDPSGVLISINSASSSELQTLNGIGEKRAADIINGRPYTKLENLVSKKIITQTMFEQIRQEIRL